MLIQLHPDRRCFDGESICVNPGCRIRAWEALVNVSMEWLGKPLSNNIIYWPPV